MDRLIVVLATGFYSGKIPFAPGTWGSAFALIPWYFCRGLSLANYLIVLGALFVVGFLTAGSAEKIFDKPDPGSIVIDEIMGMFVALTLAPNHPVAWLLGFILFRIFDVWKPFPVSWLDTHLHGGIGIMMDDVMAGIYALICLQLIWLVIGRFF
ncbi:MAG: phosphatidylglycerophosphatase A [Desulfofustis sp.]|nr:phosphatidylglycerophosphatase A [Desulfofustis sp.]NNK56463.1 phosphatidylglycerophosphatase A [Desulfofustis sp.]